MLPLPSKEPRAAPITLLCHAQGEQGLFRIGIVDDQEDARVLLHETLLIYPQFRCVLEAGDGQSALRQIAEIRPDVVLLDLRLPDMPGWECARKLGAVKSRVRIIAVSAFPTESDLLECLLLDVSGLLANPVSPSELKDALRVAESGGIYISPRLRPLVHQIGRSPTLHNNSDTCAVLTPREQEVLELMARGFEYKEIADKLAVSLSTVNSHLAHIRDKFHVHNSIELINKAFLITARS